jgi:hypothetical protein
MSDVIERRRIIADHGKVAFYNDQTILLRDVRCSYPHLDRPTAMGDGEPKYSIEAMIPDTPEYRPGIRALMQAIEEIALDHKTPPLPEDRICLKNGSNGIRPEKQGYYVFKAAEKDAPKLRGNRRDPRTKALEIIPGADASQVFYGGCWVSVVVALWWQSNKHGKRVNANLRAVQFVQNDEAFGRGNISDEDLDDMFDVIEGLDDEPY